MKTIGVAIKGGSGYGAGELLRILLAHPAVEIVSVCSEQHAGRALTEFHPQLSNLTALEFSSSPDWQKLNGFQEQVLFLPLPAEASAREMEQLASQSAKERSRVKVIDISGAFRLSNAEVHASAYPEVPFLADIRRQFVFGMTEFNRQEISQALWIANPGCLATAAMLAAAPLQTLSLAGQIVIDAKTGSSGSGKEPKATTHHPRRNSNFFSYKLFSHQHQPEIAEHALPQQRFTFLASSLPLVRGIFVSLFAELDAPMSQQQLRDLYAKFYQEAPFVRFRESSPEIQHVVGSNFCDISVAIDGTRVIVLAALDNLMKGMAGSAVQNMNVMCGIEEMTGLRLSAPFPI